MDKGDGRRNDTPLTAEQCRLVEDNIGLAFEMANRSTEILPDDDERESVALWGLCRAARAYRPETGYQFSTHAMASIRLDLIRASSSDARLIRLPCWLGEVARKGKRAHQECLEAAERVRSMRRSDTRDVPLQCDRSSPADAAESNEARARLRAAIDGLPGPVREAILDRLAGLTLTQSAARVGANRKTIATRMLRGITLLREALAKEEVAA